MSIILSSYQHCDEQQFQTLSCALYTIFSVIKLDLFIQALLLDYILVLEKNTHTHLVFLYRNQYFLTFLSQNIQQKVLAFHSVLLGACPQPCSNRADTMLYYYFHIKEHFKTFLKQNYIKIYTKTHQIVPLFKKFLKGTYAP